MSLIEHRDEGLHLVRWVREDAIAVGAVEHRGSVLVVPERGAHPWSARALESIDDDAIAQVLGWEPQVLLLGTGLQQQLAPPRLQALFLARGIGLESMSNAVAARTYNLLASEGRRVVGAFLLPG